MAGLGIGGSVNSCRLQGPKSVRSGNGLPLLALHHLVQAFVILENLSLLSLVAFQKQL